MEAVANVRQEIGGEIYDSLNLVVEHFTPNTLSPLGDFLFSIYYRGVPVSFKYRPDTKQYVSIEGTMFVTGIIKPSELLPTILKALANMKATLEREVAFDLEQVQIRSEIESQIAEARSSLWKLPSGQSIVLYKWKWITWGFRGEYGEWNGGHEDGWSLIDNPTDGGYIELLTTEEDRPVRQIKLIPAVHFPVVEKFEFHSVETLPGELVEVRMIEIPGFAYADPDDPNSEECYRTESGAITEKVGVMPHFVIRDHIDRSK